MHLQVQHCICTLNSSVLCYLILYLTPLHFRGWLYFLPHFLARIVFEHLPTQGNEGMCTHTHTQGCCKRFIQKLLPGGLHYVHKCIYPKTIQGSKFPQSHIKWISSKVASFFIKHSLSFVTIHHLQLNREALYKKTDRGREN